MDAPAAVVSHIHHYYWQYNEKSNRDNIDALVDRNKRLRRLFLFDARQMLLSLMCADECGVVWPYLLEKRDIKDGVKKPYDVETTRAEFAAVVEERRRRLQVTPDAKRRRIE
jgi:hypothetical protein